MNAEELAVLAAGLFPLAVLVPLGIKWQLEKRVVVPWCLLMSALSILAVLAPVLPETGPLRALRPMIGPLLATLVTGSVLLARFFRDPDRVSPRKEGLILSPADGKVIYVKEIKEGEFPFSLKHGRAIPLRDFTLEEGFLDRGVQIGIAMNFLDVHVNRAPVAGRIVRIRRVPGEFNSLRHFASLLENERLFTLIGREGFMVGTVQIASRLVRRIDAYHEEGDHLEAGDRMGIIHFGSQVDLLIPASEGLSVLAHEGQKVTAGVSVLARMENRGDAEVRA